MPTPSASSPRPSSTSFSAFVARLASVDVLRSPRLAWVFTIAGGLIGGSMGAGCEPDPDRPIPGWAECSPQGECCGADGKCRTGNSCNGGTDDARCDYEIQLGTNCDCNNYFGTPGAGGGPGSGGGETLPMSASGSPEFEAFWDQVGQNPDMLDSSPMSLGLFHDACYNQNIYQSCRYLGLMHIRADQPDFQAAAEAVDLSCQRANPRGCFLRGVTYHWGIGAPEDPGLAQEYFFQACDMGDSRGCDPDPFLAQLADSYLGG